MRPTTAFDDNVFDINALLHPGTIFDHPRDVLAHPSLSVSEKRHSGVLGVRCIGDRVLPRAAGACRPEGARHHRRDPRCPLRTGRRPSPSAGRQAEPSAFDVKGLGRLIRMGAMDEIRLPQHVVKRFERRWRARFGQMPEGLQPPRRAAAPCSLENDDPLRSPRVHRLLEGSLRPPKADGTFEFGRA